MAATHDGRLSRRRLPRRRLLAAGGAATTATLLGACRGSAPKSSGGTGGSAAGGAPRRGGTLAINLTTIPPGIDPFRTPSVGTHQLCSFVYSRLLKFQTGAGIDPTLY